MYVCMFVCSLFFLQIYSLKFMSEIDFWKWWDFQAPHLFATLLCDMRVLFWFMGNNPLHIFNMTDEQEGKK